MTGLLWTSASHGSTGWSSSRNELRQCPLRELRKGEPLTSRALAKRICCEEGKDIRDQHMVLDVTRPVSKAVRLLQDKRAVRGDKDRMGLWVWRLAAPLRVE